MASLGRSFKAPSYLSRGMRPGLAGRGLSSSPEVSSASSSSHSEDQFAFSAHPTPRTENAPPTAATETPASPLHPAAEGHAGGHAESDRPQSTSNAPASTNSSARQQSKPIAIQLPALRKVNTAPVYTPPEPVSARGDLPGGYFPLHEDPSKRVHRPHPFYTDTKGARHRSASLAAEPTDPSRETVTSHLAAVSDATAQFPVMDAVNRAAAVSNTPVTSYVPTGASGSPLPVGKYYPSNYEQRNAGANSAGGSSRHKDKNLRPPAGAAVTSPAKSDTQVPKHRQHDPHNRSDSEAKRRLQQYQRDMVAQATLAAREVLGGAVRRSGSSLAAAGLHGLPIKGMQLGGSIGHKPLSPRLAPLGSPGPVTPMDLESGDDSYLTKGRHVSGPDADRETEEVARAIRAEAERRRREGASSPAIELGPVTF